MGGPIRCALNIRIKATKGSMYSLAEKSQESGLEQEESCIGTMSTIWQLSRTLPCPNCSPRRLQRRYRSAPLNWGLSGPTI
jgi:hypothetical protein